MPLDDINYQNKQIHQQKTCIIWGENDKVTPPEVGQEFHQEIPNSDLFWIDKCGHAPMMEHPERFNEILFENIWNPVTSIHIRPREFKIIIDHFNLYKKI